MVDAEDGTDLGWVRGKYEIGPERSRFRPDGSREWWWVWFAPAIEGEAQQIGELARGRPVEVEFRGLVSDLGDYGHMGLYHREFRVAELREVQP